MTHCPNCYEPAPCHRCVAPVRIEAGRASWLAGILAIGVVLFFIFGIGRHWHG